MKRTAFLLVAVATVAGVVAFTAPASGHADEEASPIYGVTIPAGYRDWSLISMAAVGANLNDLRAKLGNDVAVKAYREGTVPFPDGTIIARLAGRQVTSEENNENPSCGERPDDIYTTLRSWAERAYPIAHSLQHAPRGAGILRLSCATSMRHFSNGENL